MQFDATINAGTVINFATLIVAIVVFGIRMDGRLKMTEKWIEEHKACSRRQEIAAAELQTALGYVRADVAYLRGAYDGAGGQGQTHSPTLKDRY